MSIASANAVDFDCLVGTVDAGYLSEFPSDKNKLKMHDLYGSVYDTHSRSSKCEIELRLLRRRYERALEKRCALCSRKQRMRASVDNLQAQSILAQAQIDDLVAETAFLKSSSSTRHVPKGYTDLAMSMTQIFS